MSDENKKVNLDELSISDLYSMYLFARSTDSKKFINGLLEDKMLVRERIFEIENLLMLKTFGSNPFTKKVVLPDISIEGEVPEKIDLNKFDGPGKTFVVKKNDGEEK